MVPSAAMAQSSDGPTLRATCQALQDAGDQATCLYVVDRFLDPATPPAASAEYGTDLPGPGVLQVGESADITLVKVDWKPTVEYGEPAPGNRFVAIDVLYKATVDGASYNPYDWSMVDFDGFNYDRTSGARKPELAGSTTLPLGRKAQGWVTFEVPQDVHSFEVVASANGDLLSPTYVRWRIDEK